MEINSPLNALNEDDAFRKGPGNIPGTGGPGIQNGGLKFFHDRFVKDADELSPGSQRIHRFFDDIEDRPQSELSTKGQKTGQPRKKVGLRKADSPEFFESLRGHPEGGGLKSVGLPALENARSLFDRDCRKSMEDGMQSESGGMEGGRNNEACRSASPVIRVSDIKVGQKANGDRGKSIFQGSEKSGQLRFRFSLEPKAQEKGPRLGGGRPPGKKKFG
jgi:hypothetical protein